MGLDADGGGHPEKPSLGCTFAERRIYSAIGNDFEKFTYENSDPNIILLKKVFTNLFLNTAALQLQAPHNWGSFLLLSIHNFTPEGFEKW